MPAPAEQMDAPAARKATNVSLSTALLREARQLGINISRACERGLAEQIAELRATRWLEENSEAIRSSNAHAESKGLPLAAQRRF